jgi:catalase (peroxidase I)
MTNKNNLVSETMDKALRAEISSEVITKKGNVCPLAVRLAWHNSGTFDKNDKSKQAGGTNGATMRFPAQSSDIGKSNEKQHKSAYHTQFF